MLKRIVRYFPLIFCLLFYFCIQFLVFNKGLNFRDEGFGLNSTIRILHGEIPYRDFFLTTTPGTYYLQSFVFQLFGIHIIWGRILNFIFVGALLVIFNFLLGKTAVALKTLGLLLIAITFVAIGAYGFYGLEGLVLFLLTVLLFKNGRKKNISLFLSGASLGMLFIFKQSYAIYATLGFLCLILLTNNFENKLKQTLIMLGGLLLILVPFFGYFFLNKALYQFIYFTVVFAEEVKGHRAPFILTSLLFTPFFLLLLHLLRKLPRKKAFIALGIFAVAFFLVYIGISPARLGRITDYIKDPLIYYYGFLLLFPLVIISRFFKSKKNSVVLYAVSLLAIFLGSASSGRDFTTVDLSFPLVLLLCFELINIAKKKQRLFLIVIFYSIFPLIFFAITLGSLFNKTIYVSSTIPQFEGILIPQKTESELEVLVSYVKSQIKPDGNILCFPYCPLVNVLTQRKSGSYFSFFYSETIRAKDQERVINDLKINKTKLIVLQRTGTIEKEATYEDKRLSLLRDYILNNYHPTFYTPNFVVYEK